MRYFYTDPLAAAWMAKHFGMKFGILYKGQVVWNCIGQIDRPWGPLESVADIIDPISQHEALYIHHDSHALLEPQAGDLIFYDNLHGGEAWDEFRCIITPDDERYPYVGTGEPLMLMDGGEHPYRKELCRIIQRNGIPFHWPDVES